jgi:hypothetical protein
MKKIQAKRVINITLFTILIAIVFSCEHKCETCRKFEDKTAILLDELTACDDAMIQNLESKGYYCR